MTAPMAAPRLTAPRLTAPRLLFVVNNPAFFLSHRLPVAQAARAAGFEVHVATPSGDGVTAILAHGFAHHAFYMRRGGRNPLQELRAMASLARVVAAVRPEIVHAVTIKPVLYAGVLAQLFGADSVSAVSGLGYVFLARGARAAVLQRAVRQAYRLALRRSCVIFQNEDDRAVFIAMGAVRFEQTVLIRGSGVDLRAFAREPQPESEPVVMLPSRLLWDKGVGEFVAAARALRGAARFVLVGESDASNPASVPPADIAKWVQQGVLEHWGFRADMPAVLAQAALVVLPSYREGLPKVLLEAQAVGRAVVTTDVPGCRDAVSSASARLVPVRDAEALTRAIAELLAAPERRAAMGAAGRARVEAQFSAEAIAAETVAVYRGLVGQ